MNARPIYKGTTYMLTRKTTQGMFLLKPSPAVRNCIRFCIAMAQRRAKVKIHSIVFLSNHYHIILTDPRGLVPKFTEELNKLITRSLNCKLGRWENLWQSGVQPSQVALTDPSDVLDKTVYLLANPTQAMLVSRGADWPGIRLFRKGKYRVTKPKFFFRPSSEGSKLPDKAFITLTPPPIGVPEQLCDDVVNKAVKAREKLIRLEAKRAGNTFVGASGVMSQDVYASPRRPAPKRNLSPRVAAKDKWHRIEVLQRLKEFTAEYKEKRKAFIAGVLDVVFPAGTYQMVHSYGAVCEEH